MRLSGSVLMKMRLSKPYEELANEYFINFIANQLTYLDQLNVGLSVIILELVQVNFDTTEDFKVFLLDVLPCPWNCHFYVWKVEVVVQYRRKIQVDFFKPKSNETV